jgi:hypothetical protein
MRWVAQKIDDNFEALMGTPTTDVVSSLTHGGYSWQSSFLGIDVVLQPYELTSCTYESTLHHIHAYLNFYYFKSDKWLPHKDKILGQPNSGSAAGGDAIVLENPAILHRSIYDALALFDRGHSHRAVSMIDSTCAMIQRLVKKQNPQLLTRLLISISDVLAAKYKEWIQVVLLHFYNMADILFGPQHPLTQLSSWLSKALAQSVEVTETGLRILRDGYIQHAGDDHPDSLELMAQSASDLARRGKFIEAEITLSDLQQLYESRLGLFSLESCRNATRQLVLCIQGGDSVSARCVRVEQYRRLMQLEGTYAIHREKVWNLHIRALECTLRHEYAETRVLANEAWNLGTATLSAGNAEMIC